MRQRRYKNDDRREYKIIGKQITPVRKQRKRKLWSLQKNQKEYQKFKKEIVSKKFFAGQVIEG